ncbi:MAG TPA: acyl carrier protein [Pseudonocardiaceae bacterium]|nr:acyl carrier protein [Pseudonocardiaceae bacterium]
MTDSTDLIDAQLVPDVIGQLAYLIAPIKIDGVNQDTKLVDELGFHSLALAELGFTVEDVFDIETLPQESTMSLETIGDIVKLAQEHIDKGEATLPTVTSLQTVFSGFGADWPVAA